MTNAFIIIGYFAVAIAGASVWIYRAFARAQAAAAAGRDMAAPFLDQLSLVIAVIAGFGAGLTFGLLTPVTTQAWLVGLVAAVAVVVAGYGTRLLISLWPRFAHADPLSELRIGPDEAAHGR